MKRSVKNIIMVLIIASSVACTAATTCYLGNNSAVPQQSQSQMQPPSDSNNNQELKDESTDGSESSPQSASENNSNSDSQPPEMPSGNSNSDSQPPEKPSDNSNPDGQPPEKPSGDSNSDGQPPEMPNGEQGAKQQSNSPKSLYYFLLTIEMLVISAVLIYLIMSGFNRKNIKETLNTGRRALIYILAVAVITGGLTFTVSGAVKNTANNSFSQSQMMPGGASSESVEASGATTVDGKEETLSDSYISSESDESAVLVTNGGSAAISGATVNKKSGDSSNTENSEFYGVNAGVLVQEISTATISDAAISTSAKGSNAVFSTGENSKIYIKNSTITTTGESSSRGLDATYGGYIEADNVKITTQGGSCAALATDRGEGTVIAKNSTLETNGSGSPVIYSTGDIQIEDTTGTANGSQMVVVEGKNSATVTGSTLTASGEGNRGDTDQAGIMIYQSMSGDASEGTGAFTATDSSLSIQSNSDYYKTAPMFFITNTDAVINLTNTKLSFGSGVLISAKGTSEWGTASSNGGNITLNAKNQQLSGDIEVDSISTASINLESSAYEGTINGDNSAKEITLKLDKSSKIKLTGNSYVTSLDNADSTNSNIDFNGYTLYVNGKALK